jgi:hypothetical protein
VIIVCELASCPSCGRAPKPSFQRTKEYVRCYFGCTCGWAGPLVAQAIPPAAKPGSPSVCKRTDTRAWAQYNAAEAWNTAVTQVRAAKPV